MPRAHEPDGEHGERGASGGAPGRAVVHQHAEGEAVEAEEGGEDLPDGLGALVGARCEADEEAGAVVEDGEGVAADVAGGEVALEVHLPQVVRGVVLEADEGVRRTLGRGEASVAAQDAGDGAGGGEGRDALVLQRAADRAAAPRGVCVALAQDGLLDAGGGAVGRDAGPSGELEQGLLGALAAQLAGRDAPEQVVAGGPRDREAPAEPAEVHPVLSCECEELTLPVHH